MPTEAARKLLRVVLGTPDVPDSDLLARFVASRDEDAFAEIVRRHGPMVLAVCRRVTRRSHDAEDAFQAAFLVLARRAAHVGRPELLANWLYGVAYRTALEARTARRRAEKRIVPAATEPTAPDPPDDPTELRCVIDEELAKLPDKYRSVVVLCELEGMPRRAAAEQIGIPEGTLSSRLAHARKVLAERLARRGVTACATSIGVAIGRDASAMTVPFTLTNATILAAVRFIPGGFIAPGISPAVSSLTDGVLKVMLVTRLRQLFALGLLSCGLIGVGGALAQQLGTPAVVPTEPIAPQALTAVDVGLVIKEKLKNQGTPTEPKKFAAKGVEDDDVPYGIFPSQGVVRIEDGKLVVRQRGHRIEMVKVNSDGKTVLTTKSSSGVTANTYDLADIAVFDMKGNRLSSKAWKELFRRDVHVLIATDGRLPHPREMALFRQDTLLVVLPGTPAPPQYYLTIPAQPVPSQAPPLPAQPVPSHAPPPPAQ